MSDFGFEEEEFSTSLDRGTIRRIIGEVRQHWKWVLGFMLAVAWVSSLDSYFTYLNKRIIDEAIVSGRSDALIPVNHSSRPYTALNKRVEGRHSQLSYIEVTNAQHFDTFIGLPTLLGGYDTRYIPLHVYLNRALDAMWDHLRHGKPLPESQVVRTVPRGGTPGAAPAITQANVPPIARRPAAENAIRMVDNTLVVPD